MSGGGALSGTLTQNTDGAGLATFADLSVDLVGTKQLHATSGSLGPISSNTFAITAAARRALPSTSSRARRWRACDRSRGADQGHGQLWQRGGRAAVAVVMSGGGALSGTLTQNTDGGGLASFGDLSVDLVGNESSSTRRVAAWVPSRATPPPSPRQHPRPCLRRAAKSGGGGVAIAPAVQLKVTDSFGNAVAGQR